MILYLGTQMGLNAYLSPIATNIADPDFLTRMAELDATLTALP